MVKGSCKISRSSPYNVNTIKIRKVPSLNLPQADRDALSPFLPRYFSGNRPWLHAQASRIRSTDLQLAGRSLIAFN